MRSKQVRKLTEVTGKQSYRYDGSGRRVLAQSPDGKVMLWQYAADGRLLYTSDARRSRNEGNIYLGNTLLARRSVAWGTGTVTVTYQHTDGQGSPVAESNASGAVTGRSVYEPYGVAYEPTTTDGFGYTGHVMDADTGLTYMQQRYYDPGIGRFLSIDPMASDTRSGWNFNRFSYASDNPIRFIDPDGRVTASGQGNVATCDAECHRRRQEERDRKRNEPYSPTTGGGNWLGQVVDAVVSTLAPVTSNANKRPIHPTKLPDEAAARLSATNGTALLVATGGQVALPAAYGAGEGGAYAYDAAGVMTQRVLTSPGGQRVIAASCIAIGVCSGQRPPNQFLRDIERRAQTYEGIMTEMQRRWAPYVTPVD